MNFQGRELSAKYKYLGIWPIIEATLKPYETTLVTLAYDIY